MLSQLSEQKVTANELTSVSRGISGGRADYMEDDCRSIPVADKDIIFAVQSGPYLEPTT